MKPPRERMDALRDGSMVNGNPILMCENTLIKTGDDVKFLCPLKKAGGL